MSGVRTLPMVNPAALLVAGINPAVGTPVISAAQKFVVPVPAFQNGGAALVYPAGAPKAGEPIADWSGKPIGERGIVFWNGKDQSWQAAAGDGNAVIIMNQVGEEMAASLHQRYQALGSPEAVTLEQLSSFLELARSLGAVDMYNSDRGFIRENMTPVNSDRYVMRAFQERFGHMKRDARDISTAVYIDSAFQFQGPAATPQVFEHGGVLVAQPKQELRGIQPEVFLQTYRLASDGSAISDLLRQVMTARLPG